MFSLGKLFGGSSSKLVRESAPLVEAINAFEPEMQALSDEALRRKDA
jgi:preprotein translocase subunit SecA